MPLTSVLFEERSEVGREQGEIVMVVDGLSHQVVRVSIHPISHRQTHIMIQIDNNNNNNNDNYTHDVGDESWGCSSAYARSMSTPAAFMVGWKHHAVHHR